MVEEQFTESSTSTAAAARTLPATIRGYAKAGLLDHIVTSSGQMLFKPSAAAKARELKARGLARRGRWQRRT